MSDLISRQDAIDAVQHAFDRETLLNGFMRKVAVDALKTMPSAQPDMSEYSVWLWRNAYECGKSDAQQEVIRCKDCKNWDTTWHGNWTGDGYYCPNVDGVRESDFYCADAERRTDE